MTSTTTADTVGVRFGVWGMTADLHVTEPACIGPARELLDAVLAAVDLACSRFRDDSELASVNRARGAAVGVSQLFISAVAVALRAAELTGGAVDPTCGKALMTLGYDRDYADLRLTGAAKPVALRPAPGWRTVVVDRQRGTVQVPGGVILDLGATAKALAADLAAARIAAELGCGTLVNLGGDVALAGPAPHGGWAVRVAEDLDTTQPSGRHARTAGPDQASDRPLPATDSQEVTVALHDGGIATSGTGARTWRSGERTVHHIIDPATGDCAVPYWRSVTAVAATCVDANTLTTAAIVKGEAAVAWAADQRCPMRLERHDGIVVRVAGWPEDGS